MKKILLIFTLISLFSFSEEIQRNFSIKNIRDIYSNGMVDIVITKGSNESLTITGKDSLLNDINIKTKGNKMQNKENPGIYFSSLKGAISEDLHNEGFSTAKISTILGMYENFLKFGQNACLDGFKKEERSSIIKIYDKYFKEDF